MWYEFLLEGLKKFSGEIIGVILLCIFWWILRKKFPKLWNWILKNRNPKKDDDTDDTDVKQALKKIQRQLEVRPENANAVDSQKAEELQRQLEAEKREKERIQAEARRKEEALRQAEAHKAEEARRRAEVE